MATYAWRVNKARALRFYKKAIVTNVGRWLRGAVKRWRTMVYLDYWYGTKCRTLACTLGDGYRLITPIVAMEVYKRCGQWKNVLAPMVITNSTRQSFQQLHERTLTTYNWSVQIVMLVRWYRTCQKNGLFGKVCLILFYIFEDGEFDFFALVWKTSPCINNTGVWFQSSAAFFVRNSTWVSIH